MTRRTLLSGLAALCGSVALPWKASRLSVITHRSAAVAHNVLIITTSAGMYYLDQRDVAYRVPDDRQARLAYLNRYVNDLYASGVMPEEPADA